MLDHKVSPLLDAMEVGECFARHDGASCYRITHPESGREFVLKHISIPASDEQVEALLLTGAYASEEEADVYYRKEAEALVREAEVRKRLLDCPYILPFLGVQMEKKPGVGYDVYAVLPKRSSLDAYLAENAVSHLRGINMGIDLCVALAALREEGYVHGNLKPGNVFFSDTGRFLLGDFGLISTEDMQYAVLPEQYRSSYSAPELSSFLGGLNPTVDIYSLGMILYRIYNGNHAPFEDEKTSPKAAEARRLEGEALPAPLYADYELAGIICKACAHDPAERFQTPEEMRIELEQYMRRNAVSDHLIVPPLVADEPPLGPETAQEQTEPVRFTDPEKLDESFRKTFAPDPDKGKRAKRLRKDDEPLPISDRPILSDEPPQLAADRRRLAQKLKEAKRRRKRAWIALGVALCLLAAAVWVYEFTDLGRGLWHYFVSVEELKVTEVTADTVRVRITAGADPEAFTALCRDAGGSERSARFVNGIAVFHDLTPSTQYEVRVEISGLHSLSGTTSLLVNTKAPTEITAFTVSEGPAPGTARLEITVGEGSSAPAFWTLRYGPTEGEKLTVQFAGSSATVSDLEDGVEYTFTLLESENLCLSGQTEAVFTPLTPVEAADLRLDSLRNGDAELSWRCTSGLPAAWSLSCRAPDGTTLPVELHEAVQEENGWYCTATVLGLQTDVVYEVRLTAAGLAEPLTLELVDDVIQVTDFTAEATGDGLALRWTADREPAEGWRVIAAFGDGALRIEDVVSGTECTLAVLPETDYTVTLARADGGAAAGELTRSVKSAYSRRFVQMGVNQRTTIGLYYRPDREDWGYDDLDLTGTIRFRSDEHIAFGIVAGGWPIDSDETVTVHYVVEDAGTDEVVSVEQAKLVWNEMWDGDRWAAELPALPETPGAYYFTVYVNSQRMGTIRFTIVE